MLHDCTHRMQRKRAGLTAALAWLALCASPCLAQTDDGRAKALLDEMAATMRAAQTLEARIEIAYTRTDKLSGARVERSKGTMRLKKPNLAYVAISGDQYQLMASDG